MLILADTLFIRKITTNLYDYEAHCERIRVLAANGLLEDANKAREEMLMNLFMTEGLY